MTNSTLIRDEQPSRPCSRSLMNVFTQETGSENFVKSSGAPPLNAAFCFDARPTPG